MKRVVFLIVVGSFSILASAQTMYKCGSTFSQMPCGKDAEVIPAAGVLQPRVDTTTPEVIEKLKADCVRWITEVPNWKDSSSLKFGTIRRGVPETRTVDGTTRTVRPYIGMVNGKNSYGAYNGEKVFACYANIDETKIIDVHLPS